MTHKFFKITISIILTIMLCFLAPTESYTVRAATNSSFSFVVLSNYTMKLPIGGESYLIAVTSNGKRPTFKSSASSIASVNTYGLITAKKAGSCKITAKIQNAEASCMVTITPTRITLNKTSLSLENGHMFRLTAKTSNGHAVKWKSSKSSIASVSENGIITTKKPGIAEISATADGSTSKCRVTVKSPTVKLSAKSKTLYRTQKLHLTASVSSGRPVTWKSNRKSIATVDEQGNVTAMKHGTATITATVDGVAKTCTITVAQPRITLSKSEFTLKAGNTISLTARVSSGITPEWSSSNGNVVTVDKNGKITAHQKGKAYIYAKEDGVKVKCKITVTQ